MRLFFIVACLCRLISSQTCVRCAPGKYRSTAMFTNACQNCAANTYSPSAAMTTCYPCPQNSTSAVGSSTCTCVLNYVKTQNGQDCMFQCAPELVVFGAGCECPAGTSGPSNGPCTACREHTFAAAANMRTCTDCPAGMRSVAGSVSSDACTCGVGFVKDRSVCKELSDVSVVMTFDLVMTLPASVTIQTVETTILTAISAQYNISSAYLVVTVEFVPAVRRRLLAAGTWVVTVRILFGVDTSPAQVNQTQQNVGVLSAAVVNTAVNRLATNATYTNRTNNTNSTNSTISTISTTPSFSVVTITLRASRDETGVYNTDSHTVVSCNLITWQDEIGSAQACELTCRSNEDIYAATYFQGMYILGCRPKPAPPGTPAPPGAPAPPSSTPASLEQSSTGAIVGGVVGAAVAVIGGICVYIACRKPRTGT